MTVPMPLDKEGRGPASDKDTVQISYQVWDENLMTVCICGNPADASRIAESHNFPDQCGTRNSPAGYATVETSGDRRS